MEEGKKKAKPGVVVEGLSREGASDGWIEASHMASSAFAFPTPAARPKSEPHSPNMT